MSNQSEVNIAIADVLTLLLHNQHALAAAIEEVALWARSTGSPEVHDNAITALGTLDKNASAITAGDSQTEAVTVWLSGVIKRPLNDPSE